MIVCICEGVSDRVIRARIEEGAASVSELGRRCHAGQDCGRCRAMLRGFLRGGERSQGGACEAMEARGPAL
jgi:bacterioferritin-associated ferredoxin